MQKDIFLSCLTTCISFCFLLKVDVEEDAAQPVVTKKQTAKVDDSKKFRSFKSNKTFIRN